MRWIRPTTLRGRLTLWYGGAVAIVLLFYAVLVDLSYYLELRENLDDEELWNELQELFLIEAVSFPVALIIAVAGGYELARRALSPIRKMTQQAERITAERLSERLPVIEPNDELGQLAATFNETFDRIESSFEQLRRFTADASHELRTPLTSLQSVGEVGLRSGSGENGYRETIESMLEEVEHLNRLVENLLLLSRVDRDRLPLSFTRIDLSRLVDDAVRDMEVLAEEKNQTIEKGNEGPFWIQADPTILHRAVVNVLDNAIKYSPSDGKVRIGISGEPKAVTVEIADSGPGIAAEDLPHIFERFYRADRARTRDLGGTGLGLSIAQWAVHVHEGSIEVDSQVGCGCRFRIRLPRQNGNGDES